MLSSQQATAQLHCLGLVHGWEPPLPPPPAPRVQLTKPVLTSVYFLGWNELSRVHQETSGSLDTVSAVRDPPCLTLQVNWTGRYCQTMPPQCQPPPCAPLSSCTQGSLTSSKLLPKASTSMKTLFTTPCTLPLPCFRPLQLLYQPMLKWFFIQPFLITCSFWILKFWKVRSVSIIFMFLPNLQEHPKSCHTQSKYFLPEIFWCISPIDTEQSEHLIYSKATKLSGQIPLKVTFSGLTLKSHWIPQQLTQQHPLVLQRTSRSRERRAACCWAFRSQVVYSELHSGELRPRMFKTQGEDSNNTHIKLCSLWSAEEKRREWKARGVPAWRLHSSLTDALHSWLQVSAAHEGMWRFS